MGQGEGAAQYVENLTVGPNLSAPSSYRLISSPDQRPSPVRSCPEFSPGLRCLRGTGRAGREGSASSAELGGSNSRARVSGNSSRIFFFLPTSRSRDFTLTALSSLGDPGCGSTSFCEGTSATWRGNLATKQQQIKPCRSAPDNEAKLEKYK